MTRGAGYRRLSTKSNISGVCPVHGLLRYVEIVARIDAEKLRRESEPGTPGSLATANKCKGDSKEHWHIYIPTENRMKTLRKKERRKGEAS